MFKVSRSLLVLPVQDLSYHCCIELQGEEDKLLASLSHLTSKEAGKIATVTSLHTGCFYVIEVNWTLRSLKDGGILWMFTFRAHLCSGDEFIRATTGQRSGVQSKTIPLWASWSSHLPLEAPVARIKSSAAVDLGSPLSETGRVDLSKMLIGQKKN